MYKKLFRYLKVAIIVAATFVFVIADSSLANALSLAPTSPANTNSKMEALKSSLQKNPNHLEYTEYMMLKHKYPGIATTSSPTYYYGDDYYLKPQGKSALSQEFSGGFNGPDDNSMYDGVEIITGAKAIDESLQLGSIGFDRRDVRAMADRRQLQTALELYFNDKGKYPDSLNELVPIYIGILPAGFIYSKTEASYQLTGLASEPGQIDISQVKPLEIKSHPWDSMIKNAPKMPDIFSLVPADYLTVYFRDMDKFTELEKTITDIGKPIQSIYSLNDSIAIKDKIFKRLGIKDIKQMRNFIDEAALVAYDLDAYPNTDYALVIKVKYSLFDSFISGYITAPKERQGQVGDYYVIATDKSLLELIKNTKNNKDSSLAGKKDAAYALSVLESDYDGFAYFSEDFVKKLTSPKYRIAARRRNTALNALETLQYTVFAYRDITGAWPLSFDQILSEGYIKDGAVAELNNYSIDSQGVVAHKTWGSVYDVTPVNRVDITGVSAGEKNLYDSFKQGYQNYWREFIDPVGVSIIVGDQIRFHTIILPLIDKSEYNWIKDIAGKEGIAFDFLKNPDRLPSLQMLMKLNVDDAIYAYYKALGSYADEDYKKCADDYYNSFYKSNDFSSPRPTLQEQCKLKEKSREQAVLWVKDKVAKNIDWQEKTPVFDFIGNEITIASGENMVFNLDNLSNLDVFVGIELKDQALANKFIDQVFAWYNKQRSEGEQLDGGYGLFKIESGKPVKNNYNGVDYYIVPLGFTNFYYAFLNSRLYFTVSQSALNSIIDGKTIDGKKQVKPVWSNQMRRMFDYMGEKMNLGFIADNAKLQPWLKGYIKDQWASYAGAENMRAAQRYYGEALALARSLPNSDGTIANASGYFRYAPRQWFDASITARGGKVYIESNGKQYDLEEIDLGASNYNYAAYNNNSKNAKSIKLSDITKNFNLDQALAEWQKLEDLGIAFNLTEEGLDVKVAFSNTVSSKLDSRVKSGNLYGKTNKALYIYVGAGAVLLGALLWWLAERRKKSANALGSQSANMGAAPTPVFPQINPAEKPDELKKPPSGKP